LYLRICNIIFLESYPPPLIPPPAGDIIKDVIKFRESFCPPLKEDFLEKLLSPFEGGLRGMSKKIISIHQIAIGFLYFLKQLSL